mgnify:CR=1 FL=1
MPIATLDRLKTAEKKDRKFSLEKINIFSSANIAKRKGREEKDVGIISPQSPVEESDMQPFMKVHTEAADAVMAHIDENLSFLAEKFKNIKLYKITEENIRKSVDQVAEHAFKAAATKELVNIMMRNLEAHKIFSEKLVKVRAAAGQNDVAVVVNELIEFAKFFETGLWSKLNVVTEKIWDKTGFAIGRFTSDFHLQWMRLLRDPFVQSVMASAAEAAKSLAAYKETSERFVKERKEIESKIGEEPVLEKLRQELMAIYDEYQQALAECNRLIAILNHNREDPLNSIPITEVEVQEARAKANDLDYRVEQAITKYHVAIGSVLTADENAALARLAGHAIQLHVRTTADLFFSCGMFVLNTAAFFAVKQLLVITDRANKIFKQSAKIAEKHGVKDGLNTLSGKKIEAF